MEITATALQPFQGRVHRSSQNASGSAPDESTAQASAEQTGKDTGTAALSPEDRSRVRKLQQRDREVRAHEHAHMAAGSGVVQGGASYQFQRGPDGKLYAVGGEVKINAGSVQGNPQATVQKAATIRRAALAPANPSGQDLQVAASATQMAATARAEIQAEAREEQVEEREKGADADKQRERFEQKLLGSGATDNAPSPASSLDAFA